MSDFEPCYHCGEAIDANLPIIFAQLDDQAEKVCCLGCKAVSEHIVSSGLRGYYQYRTEKGNKPEQIDNTLYTVYDLPEYQSLITSVESPTLTKITLSVENIHCAACAWLIEQSLSTLPGVVSVSVNTISERAAIVWNKNVSLSTILSTMHKIGYPSTPFTVSDAEVSIKRQEKQYIKRLGVAGLFTMQVMMLAFAMYFGAFTNMESHQTGYFKWISFALSLPVVFYSALPFLKGAITSLKSKHLSMDVSVAIAVYGAFAISFYQLVKYGFDGNKGEVYFESISMFTFLLLVGKYLEFKAKSRAILSNANLNKSLPIYANKVEENKVTPVLIQNIALSNTLIIKPGEQFCVDGVICEGSTTVNESVLTGEFSPINKTVGDTVLAGSLNNEGNVKVSVTAIGQNTALSHIGQMQEEFSKHKPKFSQLADKIAHYFVLGQLLIAFLTYVIWLYVEPEHAIWISLSVLVATCPCALSLATPTAYTCVMSRLNRSGIMVKNAEAFELLNRVTHIAFDKTGTLTTGSFEIDFERSELRDTYNDRLALAIFKLQQHSEHPIASAFRHLPLRGQTIVDTPLTDVKSTIGGGIQCLFEGQILVIGSPEFVRPTLGELKNQPADYQNVWISYNEILCASFCVIDKIKPETKATIANLQDAKLNTLLLTGDSSTSGHELAANLHFHDVKTGCVPKAKADYVVTLQKTGKIVAMVGDGINDAPVFGAADVSIAMSSGADITKQSADIIVLNNHIDALPKLISAAKQTKKTINNNLYWSVVYNIVILPIAMLGYVPPYIAVVGMSASSILVVSNSLKLLRDR